jgi:hypothetical protein
VDRAKLGKVGFIGSLLHLFVWIGLLAFSHEDALLFVLLPCRSPGMCKW